MTRSFVAGLVFAVVAFGAPAFLDAQRSLDPARQGGGASPSARESAPIDLTGYWVSYVTENWRYRMVTPAKGEYRRIPASPAAVPIIKAWDPSADERAGQQCKSYGAGAIMTVPGRLHITWQDANTLRIDTDAGTQTRLFRFSARPSSPRTRPSWQGESTARWEPVAAPDKGGSLRVVTSNLRPVTCARTACLTASAPPSRSTSTSRPFPMAVSCSSSPPSSTIRST